jgi:probable phosphoglycerate mutase
MDGNMLNTTSSSSSSHDDDTNSRIIINHLANRTSLTHTYYALRHGQSLANVAHIISSDPQISIDNHGLSEVGILQAQAAGDAFVRDYLSNNIITNTQSSTTTTAATTTTKYQGVAIFSSDFKRTRETSTIFASSLRKANIPIFLGSVIHDSRLRERYFGILNNGPDDRYQEVWDIDSTNPNHTLFHNESANDVLERTTKFICELDDNILSSTSSSSAATAATTTTTINDGTTAIATATTKKEEGGRWICILVAHGDVLQITQTGFLRHTDARGHRSLNHLETATLRELTLAPLL